MPKFVCPTCYSEEFTSSRVRPGDRLQLLLFRLPVRCTRCRLRTYAPRSFVRLLKPSGRAGKAGSHGGEA